MTSLPIELDTLLELAENQAREILLGHQHLSLSPTWLMLNAAGEVGIIATPWRNDFERLLTQAFIKDKMKKFQATSYSLVVEAWTSTRNTLEGPRPSKDPDRREVVMCLATDGTQAKWRQLEIRRDWNERIIGLEARDLKDYKACQSWMANLLDKSQATK